MDLAASPLLPKGDAWLAGADPNGEGLVLGRVEAKPEKEEVGACLGVSSKGLVVLYFVASFSNISAS